MLTSNPAILCTWPLQLWTPSGSALRDAVTPSLSPRPLPPAPCSVLQGVWGLSIMEEIPRRDGLGLDVIKPQPHPVRSSPV